MAWLDTGTVYALSQNTQLRSLTIARYAGRLLVASAVAQEIRSMAATPAHRRSAGEHTRTCIRADTAATLLEAGTFRIAEPSSTTAGRIGDVLAQLRQIDEARGNSDSKEDRAGRHAGEAASIVGAERFLQAGRPAIFLTSDGGASLVAERLGIPSKHIGHLLAELACGNPELDPAELMAAFTSMTNGVATPPSTSIPTDESFFRCKGYDDQCLKCDRLA